MLTALERGLKGGKWFSLIDKVYAQENLRSAFAKVKRNGGAPGVDHQTVGAFEEKVSENLERLSTELKDGRYRPSAVRRKMIPKAGGGERPLGIPTVRDRVMAHDPVQWRALARVQWRCAAVEPGVVGLIPGVQNKLSSERSPIAVRCMSSRASR